MAQKTIMESSLMLAVIREWANGKFLTSGDIVSAYKASGTKQASELTSSLLVAGNVGNVYNLSTALTITSENKNLFVENAEGSYPKGTNVVVINAGTSESPSYKFDILAGFVDTSSFLTAQDVVNGGNTASWGSSVTIGTVGGVSLTFTMPANPDTHYTAVPVLGGSSATTNATTATADPYLNIVENNAKSGGVQIKGSDNISVSASNGVVTFSENFSWMTQAQAEAILNAST